MQRANEADKTRLHVKDARLLIDAWFMRKSLILPLLEQRVRIIGQVRRDTALFLPPEGVEYDKLLSARTILLSTWLMSHLGSHWSIASYSQ